MNTFVTARILRVAAAIGSTGALATGVLAAAATPAGASTLSCGDTITSNVTLHRNLDCASYTGGPGLVIGRRSVTLNLNGHTILGPGGIAGSPGVLAGFRGDKVKGGAIEGFPLGVVAGSPTSHYLTGVVIHDLKITDTTPSQRVGILAFKLKDASISEVSVTGMSLGMLLFGSRHITVTHNSVQNADNGIIDETGAGDTFSRNDVRGILPEGAGVIVAGTKGDKVTLNSVAGKGAAGIAALSSASTYISGNALSHLYYGVLSDTASKDEISHNHGSADAWGMLLASSTKTAVIGNTFGRGGTGIEADAPAGLIVKHNVTSHNAQIGVLLTTQAPLGISKNTPSPASPGPSALVSFNKSSYNNVGFYSQFPATGRGNDADHDTVLACHNVSCSHAAGRHHGMLAMPARHSFWLPAVPKAPSFRK